MANAINVLPKEGDPPGRPYKNLYYLYERNLVSYPTAPIQAMYLL